MYSLPDVRLSRKVDISTVQHLGEGAAVRGLMGRLGETLRSFLDKDKPVITEEERRQKAANVSHLKEKGMICALPD